MKTTFENFDALPDSAHVRLPVVVGLFACSAATVWRRVKDGQHCRSTDNKEVPVYPIK